MRTRFFSLFACLSALLLADSAAHALFLKPDLKKIPVDQLIKNLEKQAAKSKKGSATVRYNLARVHAMAYALKIDACDIPKKAKDGDGPWFGFTPGVVPFKSVAATDKEKLAAAKTHLDKAIATYKDLLKDQPMNVAAQLGLAWCIQESGDKAEAIKAYRDVIEAGWDKERKLKAGPLGGNYITKEAAGYLIPLLDKNQDAAEIASIKARVAILTKLPRPVTPIAIPLKDGLAARDLEDRDARVRFDADGSGLDRRWSWINKNAAWLVHDPRQSGTITSGLQLFGNVTFWCFWDNGYQALAALDDNCDGALSGAELAGLALWHDANGNGISDPGEVRSLADCGIVALSCRWQTDARHPEGIAFSPRGVTFRDGTARPTFDLILRQR